MRIGEVLRAFRGARDFHVDFIGRRRVWFLLSAGLITLALVGLFVRGLNLGIDFRGGALLTYRNETGVSADAVRREMAGLGHRDAVVQAVGGGDIRVRTSPLGDEREEVLDTLAAQAGVQPSAINVEDIGPKWGAQISSKALQALLIFLLVVSIYISFRFEWKMAVGAQAALFHDLIITAGIYALVGREVTPETIVAVLTILGYSLYDTVVIFDKIKENTESASLVARETYSGAVNRSLNQVLVRSVNTSATSLLPIGALLIFGGETLQGFAFALFVGVAVGTYSSLFVAAPVLTLLKEREPRMAQIRERAARRGGRPALQAVPAGEAEAEDRRELVPAATATRPRAARPPQRRKPKKKPRSKRRKR